jgi:hypothetical protein
MRAAARFAVKTPISVLLAASLGALLATSCGKAPPRAPNPTTPISERRAIEIIGKGIRKEKLEPDEARDVKTTSGALVHVDVGINGRKFGIAYLTENDLNRDDADRLPKKDPQRPRALVVADGVGKDEGDTHVLLLVDRDYRYDDQVGEEHESTSITAEATLERDVRDFVVLAKSKHWE